MAMFNIHKIIFNFFFLTLCVYSQNEINHADWAKEIRSMSKYSIQDHRPEARSFLQFMSSDDILTHQKKQIYIVLNNFKSRKFGFSDYYVPFFKLILKFKDDHLSSNMLDELLHLLSYK